MSDYGLLQEVIVTPRGTSLAADAAVSDTDLVVDSAGDFAEDGGTLELNGIQLEYTGITWGVTEDDEDTITLAEPLAVGADEDDAVAPVLGGLAAEDAYAVVDMGPGDAVHIPLSYSQRVLWPEGTYADVPVIVSDDLQHIEDAPGRPSTAGPRIAFKVDTFTILEPGDQTLQLTYTPLPDSLHVKWIPLDVPADQVSLVDNILTVADASSILKGGGSIQCWYAYDPAGEAVTGSLPEPTGGTILAFEASAWKFKQVARADATDYSAAAFDDSAWASDPASFGDGGDMSDGSGGGHVTLWQKTTRMWARRTLTGMTVGGDITATVRADDTLRIWLDGTQVYDGHPNGLELTVVIPGSYVTSSSMKLACRVTDEADSEGCFFDLELVQ